MRSQGNDTQLDVLLTKFEEHGLAIERGIALFQTIVSPIFPNEKMKIVAFLTRLFPSNVICEFFNVVTSF